MDAGGSVFSAGDGCSLSSLFWLSFLLLSSRELLLPVDISTRLSDAFQLTSQSRASLTKRSGIIVLPDFIYGAAASSDTSESTMPVRELILSSIVRKPFSARISFLAPFHVTSAPRRSNIARIGTNVMLFFISGETSVSSC